MASGQSKGVSWKVLGGDGAKKGLEEKGGGSSTPRYKGGGGSYGESPEFLTKGQFRRGAERVIQSMFRPRVVVEWGKDVGLEGKGASFKT